jgi:hypothetical protein
MSSKTAGLILAIGGVLVALVFVLADVTGMGIRPGFGYRQAIGTAFGVLVFVVGIVVLSRPGQT